MRNIIFIIIIFSATLINAQTAILDTSQIEIGDQIKLRLQVANTGKDIIFPFFEKNIIKGIDIVKSYEIDTLNNGKTLEKAYLITSFDDSLFNIEPLKIMSAGDTLKTNPLILRVTYPRIDSTFMSEIDTLQMLRIRDVKDVLNTPLTFKEFWARYGMWIIIVLIIITLSIVGYFVYKRYKENRPIFVAPKPVIPPHIIAEKSLQKLREKRLAQQSKFKQYYTELTDILRIYIEKRFDIPAMEYVSSEIISAFEGKNIISETALEKLKPILATADLVKFAKGKPFEHENDLNMKNAFTFVELTKPKEEEKLENNQKEDIKIKENQQEN